MKKIIAIFTLSLITLGASAQAKKAKSNNRECFLQTTAETANLSEENKKSLASLYDENEEQRIAVRKQVKSGEISKEDGKAQMKQINGKYFTAIGELSGKSKKEAQTMVKEVREKCKN